MTAVPLVSSDPSASRAVTIEGKRFAFVCGLHRSGTSLITRCLAQHPMISTFANTAAIEDEGQFLQSVLPLERTFGGAGRFGFDPRAHMTETSELNDPASARRLVWEWSRYWDTGKTVMAEKTPSNLLRMRLLAQLVEPASFIIVTRHPVATSLATMKWMKGTAFSLVSHWVHCYAIARRDARLVERTVWVSYEAFVSRPEQELARLVRFLGLPPLSTWSLALRDENARYFDLWRSRYFVESDRAIEQVPPERKRSLVTRARERLQRDRHERSLPRHKRRDNVGVFHDALDAVAMFEPAVNEFGYSLIDLARAPGVASDPLSAR